MALDYVKSMIQRDIDEKQRMTNLMLRFKHLMILIVITGLLLFVAILGNSYLTYQGIQAVYKNREVTLVNRTYGDTIIDNQKVVIRKQDTILDEIRK